MIHPEYRLGEGGNLVETALTPVYPTVSGLGQKHLAQALWSGVNLLGNNPPEDLLAI